MGQKKRHEIPYFNSKNFLKFVNPNRKHTFSRKKRKRNSHFSKQDFPKEDFSKEESSNSKNQKFLCKICKETTLTRDAFYLSGCSHLYCSDCVAAYIRYKLEYNVIDINCPVPECSGSLEAGFCRSILRPEVFERWDKALCEVLFNITEKFYCPFADCCALLINDVGTEAVSKLECPNCNRMVCAQGKVRFYEGIEFSELKKLNRDDKAKDVMLTNIAKNMRWRQCPKCRFYVSKSESCNIMKCRSCCKFCYRCGGVISTDTGKCNCYKRNLIYPAQRTVLDKNSIFWDQQLNDILQSFRESETDTD